jgi:hypothetical protein
LASLGRVTPCPDLRREAHDFLARHRKRSCALSRWPANRLDLSELAVKLPVRSLDRIRRAPCPDIASAETPRRDAHLNNLEKRAALTCREGSARKATTPRHLRQCRKRDCRTSAQAGSDRASAACSRSQCQREKARSQVCFLAGRADALGQEGEPNDDRKRSNPGPSSNPGTEHSFRA